MSRTDPCPTPWCDHSDAPYVWQGPDDQFTVICGGCQVEGPHCETEAGAIEGWNTRTTEAPADVAEVLKRFRNEAVLVADQEPFVEVWETDRDAIVAHITRLSAQLAERDARLAAVERDRDSIARQFLAQTKGDQS